MVNCPTAKNPRTKKNSANLTFFFSLCSRFSPRRLDHETLLQDVCGSQQHVLLYGNASNDSQFFVAVGVLAWLFVIAALFTYVVFHTNYDNNPLLPVIVSSSRFFKC